MKTRHWSAIVFLGIVALPFALMSRAGRPPGASATGPRETLVILSPHRREVRQEYSRGFGEWMRTRCHRNVDITWLDVGGTTKILKDLESRFASSPDDVRVDLFFGGGVSPYHTALERGWLATPAVSSNLLAEIPALCAGTPVYDPGRRWFGVALSGFGIVYNRVLLQRLGLPEPKTWDDLGRPEFLSWVASGDPRSSGSVHMCYEIILQAYGFDRGWNTIARLCANVRRFGEGGGVAPREVASGDVAAGLAIDQYALTVVRAVGGDALGFVLPQGATVIDADAIGQLRGASSPELASLFIEYALSADGQRLLFQPAGAGGQRNSLQRLPVRAASYEEPFAPKANPYRYESRFRFDSAREGRRRDLVNDLIGATLIDAHDELVRAWKAAVRSGLPAAMVGPLCAPPLSEAELDALAPSWKDPRKRVETMRAWSQQAKERYRRIAGQHRVADGSDAAPARKETSG